MNFKVEFLKGQEGQNKGLPMGPGMTKLAQAINGIQKSRYFGIAAPPKAGKSTFINYSFVIQPYLHCLKNNIPFEVIYFSLEMDRISQEFDFAAFFLFYDYGITTINLPEGTTKRGEATIGLSSEFLRGRAISDQGDVIKVPEELIPKIQMVYQNRIKMLFGEYDENGKKLSQGAITFIEKSDNPTGIYKYLMKHAERNGSFIEESENGHKRIVNYRENDSSKYTLVIMDHMRKLIPERGMSKKEVVDKMSEYFVILRNLTKYTFSVVIHLNRGLTATDRARQFGDNLHPSSDDVKDSGFKNDNCHFYLFSLFSLVYQSFSLSL